MSNVLAQLKPCSFGGPPPGMAANVTDEHRQSVRGQVGELVIRQPWIGMTRGFWKDPQRYLDTYWSRFPNAWVHGDWEAPPDRKSTRLNSSNRQIPYIVFCLKETMSTPPPFTHTSTKRDQIGRAGA